MARRCDRATLPALVATLALLSDCGDGEPALVPPAVPARPCPAGWVAGARGGCGPAVLLCAPDGGAAAGVCAGVDLARPAPIPLPGGGAVAGFRRLAGGGVGGAWPEPGDVVAAGLAACPAGWRRTDDGACDPVLRDDCAPGSAALPGGRCTPTAASDCPTGEFPAAPEGTDPARVVYVRAGSDAAAADGSRAAPFATLGAALTRLADGGAALVARGAYRERIRIDRSVAIVGVCAAGVTLDGASLPSAGPVVVNVLGEGVRVTLSGLTVRGAAAGVRSHFGAHVRVERAVVTDCEIAGLYAYEPGSTLEVASSVVRGVREREALLGGFGLHAFDGGAVRATDVAVEAATAIGVAARDRGDVSLERCVVRGTQRGAGGDSFGAEVKAGAALTATATAFVDHRSVGVSAHDEGARVDLHDVAVRAGGGGLGVQVYAGASLRAVGLQVVDARGAGLHAGGAGTTATVAGSLVRRTTPLAASGGQGLVVDDGAALHASSTAVEASTGQGVVARGAGTSLTLEGCAVRDTAAVPARRNGAGLVATAGAAVRGSGLVVERSVSFGLVAHGEGTAVSLAGSAIRDTRRDAWGGAGRGVAVSVGASLDLAGVLVADSFEDGVFATGAGAPRRARPPGAGRAAERRGPRPRDPRRRRAGRARPGRGAELRGRRAPRVGGQPRGRPHDGARPRGAGGAAEHDPLRRGRRRGPPLRPARRVRGPHQLRRRGGGDRRAPRRGRARPLQRGRRAPAERRRGVAAAGGSRRLRRGDARGGDLARPGRLGRQRRRRAPSTRRPADRGEPRRARRPLRRRVPVSLRGGPSPPRRAPWGRPRGPWG